MKLDECYCEIGENLDSVLSYGMKRENIEKYIRLFRKDSSFDKLGQALKDKDYENAFCMAHNVKGICGYLSFSELEKWAVKLTEQLRNCNGMIDIEEMKLNYNKMKHEYVKVISAIDTYLK